MGNALKLSMWRKAKGRSRISVQGFLRSIGVPFKKRNRHGFWLTNESELDYIFHDMCFVGRKIKIQLHPQNGGDPEIFSDFCKELERVKRLFYRYGVRNPSVILDRVREWETLEAQVKARRDFRSCHPQTNKAA